MSFILKVLYLSWMLSIGCVLSQQPTNTVDGDGAVELLDEETLIKHLRSNYHKKIAPAKPVVLKYGICPVKIVDVDVGRGLATIDVWLRHNWQDQRLVWDTTVYDADTLFFNVKDVFVPEMALYNGILTPTLPDPQLATSPEGNMIYFQPARAEIYCELPSLPFTNVICPIVIGPWSHNIQKTTLETFDPVVDTSFLQETGKCRIQETWAELHQSSYDCCPQSFGTMVLYLRINCSESEDFKAVYPFSPAAEARKSKPKKVPVYPESEEKCSLPLVITPFFVLLIFLLPQKATDRVFLGTIVFAALLLIWTSDVVPPDEERFIQLSAIVSISATFASLVPCRLSSTCKPANQMEEYGPKPSWCKNRVATMVDLMFFAAVAIVLGISSAGTFA